MTLTPEDIQNKEFNVRFRGLDADEVDGFLEEVAEQYLLLLVEKKKYKDRVAELKEEMAQIKEEQKSFQKAFLAAQEIAEEMRAKGRRESEEMLEDAREEVDRIRARAEEERKDLEEEIEDLRGEKTAVIAELRRYLQAHIDRLDNGGVEDGPVPPPGVGVWETDAKNRPNEENPAVDGPATSSQTAEISDTDDDLADLYQKIDLPDIDGSLAGEETEEGDNEEPERDLNSTLIAAISGRLKEDKEEESPAIPDLDGEMLFRLEDPLEDLNEPAVVLDDEKKV